MIKRGVQGNTYCTVSNISCTFALGHDDVMIWRRFLYYWSFVRGNHRHRWIPLTKGEWCRFVFVISLNKLFNNQMIYRWLRHHDTSVTSLLCITQRWPENWLNNSDKVGFQVLFSVNAASAVCADPDTIPMSAKRPRSPAGTHLYRKRPEDSFSRRPKRLLRKRP